MWLASCSCRLERDVEKLCRRFPVLEAFRNDRERKGLDAGYRFITILPVADLSTTQRYMHLSPASAFAATRLRRDSLRLEVEANKCEQASKTDAPFIAMHFGAEGAANEPRERSGARGPGE